MFGGQDSGAEGPEDVVVGGGAGVAAGSEAVQDAEGGEGPQAVFGGVEVLEGEPGELVAGQHLMLREQPAQLAVTFGESSGQPSHPEGNPIGSSPASTTSRSRHLITASESPTSASA